MKNINGYDNYTISMNGEVVNTRTDKKLYVGINKDNGYLQVKLYAKNKGKNFYIHRLIALAYIDNPLSLPEVNHKDSDRLNNSISNLEWVTSQGNSEHAVLSGQRDHVARMSKQEVENAFNLVMKGFSYKEISEQLSNTWQSGFLSVKVGQYAKKNGMHTELKEELRRQRVIRSLKNLESINNV